MSAIKFTESIVIDRPNDVVFDYTQDYNTRLQWDTFLKQADLLNGATGAGKDISAYCVAKNGLGMVTEYITFNRPKATAIRMTKGPYLFKTFLGSWNFNPVGNDKTEVVFIYSFTFRFPFNLATSAIKNILQKNVKQRLKDLKLNIEG